MGGLRAPELWVILLVAVLLFGGRKVPELARGLGEGLRVFRDEVRRPAAAADPADTPATPAGVAVAAAASADDGRTTA